MASRVVQSFSFTVPFWFVALALYIADGPDSPGSWAGVAVCLACIVVGLAGVLSLGEARMLVGSISWVRRSEVAFIECVDSRAVRWIPVYLVPVASFALSDGWATLASLVWAAAWVDWALAVTGTCYLSPTLLMAGWHFYRVTVRLSDSDSVDMTWLSLGPLRADGTVVLSSWRDGTVRLVQHVVE